MVKKMNKNSREYARIVNCATAAIEKEFGLSPEVTSSWSLGRLCKKLGVRLADGTQPSGNRMIKAAMIQWAHVRTKVVVLPIDSSYRYGADPERGREKKDRALLVSAASSAGLHIKQGDRALHDSVNSDAFLSSKEWRQLRTQALMLWGCRCQRCGATEADGAIINCDHIKPRRLFPKLALELSNIQVLCADCNRDKGNWDHTDWRPTQEQFEAAALSAYESLVRLSHSAYGATKTT